MNKKHLDKLKDISACTGIGFDELFSIYTFKSLDYRFNDIRVHKEVKEDKVYDNRAMEVVRRFYTKKYDYTKNRAE